MCGSGRFPGAVAFQSVFSLEFSRASDLPAAVRFGRLESFDTSILSHGSGDRFRAERHGVGVIAALTTDGDVIDYLELEVVNVDELTLARTEPRPRDDDDTEDPWACNPSRPPSAEDLSPDLYVGESAVVEASALGEGRFLGGSLSYDFEVLTPELLSASRVSLGRSRLQGLAVGTAELAVDTGGWHQVFEIEITEAPVVDDATGSSTGDDPGPPRRIRPDASASSGSDDDSGDASDTTGGDSDSGDESGSDTGNEGTTGADR